MSNTLRRAGCLVLALVGMMALAEQARAGRIKGALVETDGATAVADTLRVDVLDFQKMATGTSQANIVNGQYDITVTPTTTDKSVYIQVTRRAKIAATVGPLNGNKPVLQTIDIIVPVPAFAPPAPAELLLHREESQVAVPECGCSNGGCSDGHRHCRGKIFRCCRR